MIMSCKRSDILHLVVDVNFTAVLRMFVGLSVRLCARTEVDDDDDDDVQ